MAFLFKSRKHPHSQHQSAQAASAHHPEGSGGGVERSGSSSKSSHHSRSRTMGPASSGTQALPQPQQQLHTSRSDEHQFRPVEDNYHLGQNFPHPHHYNSSQNQLNLQQQQQASPEKRSRGGSLSEPRHAPTPARSPTVPPFKSTSIPWSQRRIILSSIDSSPFPRYGAAANAVASKEGDIYVMGGMIKNKDPDKAKEVFLTGDLWLIQSHSMVSVGHLIGRPVTAATEPPCARVGHRSLLVGNAFIVFGGDTKIRDTDKLDNTLYLLNTSSRQWSRAQPKLPHPAGRHGHSMNIIGSKLYIFGGQSDNPNVFFNDMVAFDLNSLLNADNKWDFLIKNTHEGGPPIGQVPAPRCNHSMVAWNNRLYLFGGTDKYKRFKDIWCYDPRTTSWTFIDYVGSDPMAREGHAAATVNDIMYVFGGRGQDREDLGKLVAFRFSDHRWFQFQKMGPEPSPRSGHTMSSVSGQFIVVLGGEPSERKNGDAREEEELSWAYVLDTNNIRYQSGNPSQQQSMTNRAASPSAARAPSRLQSPDLSLQQSRSNAQSVNISVQSQSGSPILSSNEFKPTATQVRPHPQMQLEGRRPDSSGAWSGGSHQSQQQQPPQSSQQSLAMRPLRPGSQQKQHRPSSSSSSLGPPPPPLPPPPPQQQQQQRHQQQTPPPSSQHSRQREAPLDHEKPLPTTSALEVSTEAARKVSPRVGATDSPVMGSSSRSTNSTFIPSTSGSGSHHRRDSSPYSHRGHMSARSSTNPEMLTFMPRQRNSSSGNASSNTFGTRVSSAAARAMEVGEGAAFRSTRRSRRNSLNVETMIPEIDAAIRAESPARKASRRISSEPDPKSPRLTQMQEALFKENEAMRKSNAWLSAELALARKAGYVPTSKNPLRMSSTAAGNDNVRSSTLSNGNEDPKSRLSGKFETLEQNKDSLKDEDKPLLEALLLMREELARTQGLIDQQTQSTARKIAEIERQRDVALREAMLAQATLAAYGHPTPQDNKPTPENPAQSSVNNDKDIDAIQSDRDSDISRRLALAVVAQTELRQKVESLDAELREEKRHHQMDEENQQAKDKRIAELENKAERAGQFEGLRSEIAACQLRISEERNNRADLENRLRLVEVEKTTVQSQLDDLEAKWKASGGENNFTSFHAAVAASQGKAQIMEKKFLKAEEKLRTIENALRDEQASKENLEKELSVARKDLSFANDRVNEAHEVAQGHAREAETHRAAFVGGLQNVLSPPVDHEQRDRNEELTQALRNQVREANEVARANQQSADQAVSQAAEQLRLAEERIASLEQSQEQASREELSLRQQLQAMMKENSALTTENHEIKNQLENYQREANTLAVQHGALKELLEVPQHLRVRYY